MFYTFHQNNSGGSFVHDNTRGIAHYVIIEASNDDEANARAEEIGLYFEGVEDGIDCECCGDRWNRANNFYPDKTSKPMIYSKEAADSSEDYFIHYADGRIEASATSQD